MGEDLPVSAMSTSFHNVFEWETYLYKRVGLNREADEHFESGVQDDYGLPRRRRAIPDHEPSTSNLSLM